MVVYLTNLLQAQQVVTLSRGYGRKTKGFRKVETSDTAENVGDEPLMFAHTLPHAQVFVGENRCVAIDQILATHPGTGIILLDDAYQHMAVKAGLNILITRYDSPFWKDHLLPAGNLREPANGAARAHVVVITGCPPDMNEGVKIMLRQACAGYTKAPVFFTTTQYGTPQAVTGNAQWKNRYDSLLTISGIAQPQAFQKQAATYTGHIQHMAFADHHPFTAEDMKKIASAFTSLPGEKAILTTAKDRVRLLSSQPCLNMLNQVDAVFYQPMELAILDDPKKFDQIILQYAQAHS